MKLAKRVIQMAESATLAVSTAAARMKAQGIDVIGFGAGEPDFDTPEAIRAALTEAVDAGHTRYSKPSSGALSAKKAVCEKLCRENDLTYAPEQVIITSGGKMALALAFQAAIEEGDEVVIPRPYWVSYPEMVKMAGGTPVFASGPAGNDYKLTPEDLESVLTRNTRAVVINSPSNPSGVTYHPDEIRALAGVLAERDVLVISDEIYDRLLYGGQKTLSYATTSDAGYAQTLTVNSASKTYAMTGWRLAYAAGPVDLVKAMAKIQSQTTSGAVTFNQQALIAALTGDQAPVEDMRREFEKRAEFMWSRLNGIDDVSCPRPTGAFYCFPNVGGTFPRVGCSGSVEFCTRLLEEARVAAVPGIAFGLDEHIRISFATSMDQIEEGLRRIESFVGG